MQCFCLFAYPRPTEEVSTCRVFAFNLVKEDEIKYLRVISLFTCDTLCSFTSFDLLIGEGGVRGRDSEWEGDKAGGGWVEAYKY